MKECDQKSGHDLNGANTRRLGGNKFVLEPKIDGQGRKIGTITGILLEDTQIKISKKGGLVGRGKRMASPDMWEMK